MPPPLVHPDHITRDQHFETTTGKAHDRKYPATTYSNTIHQKAPGHWKVDYVKDLAEKVRRPIHARALHTVTQWLLLTHLIGPDI